jgi:protein-S-isoprenylcysteine O-methyltransferase Ste14
MPASARRASSTRARGSSRGVAERATTTRAASSEKARARDAPTTTHYEFGGPIGALAITVALPLVCYFLAYACNEDGCAEVSKLARGGAFPGLPKHMPLWSVDGAVAAYGWMAFTVVAHAVIPGQKKQGVALPDGTRLTYKLNGFRVFAATAVAGVVGTKAGWFDLASVHDNFLSMLTAMVVFAYALSAYLYASSFAKGKTLAKGGNSGNAAYDFFIGRELNPRILNGAFDLKVFCELTPGLIGWLLLDLGFAAKQYARVGAVSAPMIMVCVFQGAYVIDALWNEPAILTTMDITTDGFGFMLAFGDLVWVPFTYSLQCRYILEHAVELSNAHLVAIFAVQCVGYWVFRGANSQKNLFRTNPNDPRVKHLKTLQTKRGTKLIVSGWWGVCRHINYLGDWIMAWAWCLPCGFSHLVPYFYVIYFGILLVHRDGRDGEACEEKYGDDWKKYCAIVKYRLIPYIY